MGDVMYYLLMTFNCGALVLALWALVELKEYRDE